MDPNMSWLFITVGIGRNNFREAAQRLCHQAEKFEIFSKIKSIDQSEIEVIAPYLKEWYPNEGITNTSGYGWYAWKSTVAREAFNGRWGDFENIMYLDAGCEMFLSSFSRRRLIKYMNITETKGSCLFAIKTQESSYSKSEVYDKFKEYDYRPEIQIQAGSWLMRKDVGKLISEEWENFILKGPHTVDISISPKGEHADFVEHRYDQSVFSLLAKKHKLNISDDRPPGKIGKLKYLFRSFFFPFWWARSRNGKSQIPFLMILLGRISNSIFNSTDRGLN